MIRFLPLLFALMLPMLPAQPIAPGGEPDLRAILSTSDPQSTASILGALGYDVGKALDASTLELFLSTEDLSALQLAGMQPAIVEMSQPLAQKLAPPEGTTPTLPAGYHDPVAIAAALSTAQTTWPALVQVVDVAALYGPGATFEGRPIQVLKISDNVLLDEDEPNLLVAANHHAREIVTPELCLELINVLLTGYGTDPVITALVDSNEIWIAPNMNPDGLDHVWTTNNMWRKNRKPEGSEFGVDQNRNYLLGWSAPCGGSTNPASGNYRGLAPSSEEETATMLAFSRDRRFAKVMDFHSSGQEILLSYLCSAMPTSIETFIDAEATTLAGLAMYSTRQPSAEGEHQQWQIMETTSYAFLVETATSFQPPFADVLTEAAALLPLELAWLQRDIPLTGHVTDGVTGLPVVAELTVAGINWQNGETRLSDSRFGRYHLWLPPGLADVTYSAPGYLPQTVSVTVPATGTLIQDVALQLAPPAFTVVMSTTGGGVNDLHLGFQNIPTGTQQGFLVLSFLTTSPVGQGPLAGIWPDMTTLALLAQPAAPGNPIHWTWPVSAPLFPAQDLLVPPAGIPFPAGTEMDGIGAALSAQYAVLGLTDVLRIVF